MFTVKVEQLSREAFAPFGRYVDLLKAGDMDEGKSAFFPDLMDLTVTQPVSVSVGRACGDPHRIPFIESHPGTAEARIPLDGDIVIYVAPVQSLDSLDLASIRAFIVPRGTLIELAPGVLHGRQFPAGFSPVRVMILCYAGAAHIDTVIRYFEEGQEPAIWLELQDIGGDCL